MGHIAGRSWYSWLDQAPVPAILDGGLGTALAARGHDICSGSLWSSKLLHSNRKELYDVAIAWLSAGADIVTTATYQATAELFRRELGIPDREANHLIASAWSLLDDARKYFWSSLSSSEQGRRRYPVILFSFGPLSAVREDTDEYSGTYKNVSHGDFCSFHAARMEILDKYLQDARDGSSTVVCFETIGNNEESLAIVDVMSTPLFRDMLYWISFQCRDASHLACGTPLSLAISAALDRCNHQNLVAIGVNCVNVSIVAELVAVAREAIEENMRKPTTKRWRVDTVAYPNSGEHWTEAGWSWNLETPLHGSNWASLVLSSEAKVVGGCCRTSTDHISALSTMRNKRNKISPQANSDADTIANRILTHFKHAE